MPIILGTNPSLIDLKITDEHVLSSMSNRWNVLTIQKAGFRTITERPKQWLFDSQNPLLNGERCRFKDVFDIEERKYLS